MYDRDNSPKVRQSIMQEMLQRENNSEIEALFDQIEKVKADIEYWKSRDDSTATDAEVAERHLKPLELELKSLEEKRNEKRGDDPKGEKPTCETAPVVPAGASGGVTPGKRTNYLTPAIETAQGKCEEKDKLNAPAVYAKLRDMASARLTPFIGVTEDGLQWLDSNDHPQTLSLGNLRDRLNRQKTNSAKTR